MLFELAYPGLFLAEGVRHVMRRPRPGPAFGFRAVKCRMRRREIALLTAISPRAGATLALRRFERARPERAARPAPMVMRTRPLVERRFGTGHGPRVLTLHGWNADSAMMLPLARSLSAAGADVVVPDLPGEGGNRPRVLSFGRKAEALAEAYADHEFDAVIGHSAGGLIAAQAIEHGLRARTMVTICAPYSMAALLAAYLLRTGAPDAAYGALLDLYAEREARDPDRVGPDVFRAHAGRMMVAHARSDWQVPLREAHQIGRLAATEPLILDRCNHHTILQDTRLHGAVAEFLMPSAGVEEVAC